MARFLDSTASIKKEAGKKSKKKKEQKKAASKPQSSSAPKKNYTSNAAKNIVNNTVGGAKKTTKKIGQTASKQKSKSTVDRLSTKYGGGSTRSSQISSQSREKRNNRINTRPRRNEALSRNPRIQDTSVAPTRRQASEMQERARRQRPRTAREEQAQREAQRRLQEKYGTGMVRGGKHTALDDVARKIKPLGEDIGTGVVQGAKHAIKSDERFLNFFSNPSSGNKFYNRELNKEDYDRNMKRLELRDKGKRQKIKDIEAEMAEAKERHGWFGQRLVGAAQITGERLADVPTGPFSLVHMGVRSTSSSLGDVEEKAEPLKKKMREAGFSEDEINERFKNVGLLDLANAIVNAGVDTGTEKMFDAPGLPKIYGKGFLDRVGDNLFGARGQTALGRLAKGNLEEIAEEEAAGPIQTALSNAIYGNKFQGINREIAGRSLDEVLAASSNVNSKEFADEARQAFRETGMSDKEADALAEYARQYSIASLEGDSEGQAKARQQMIDVITGGENSMKEKWTLRDAFDTAVETAISTTLTAGPDVMHSAAIGKAYKETRGLDGVRKLAEVVKNLDPENSKEAGKLADYIKDGGDVTNTQVYELMGQAQKAAGEATKREETKVRMAAKAMKEEDLRVSPMRVTSRGYILGEATEQRFEEYSDRVLDMFEEDTENTYAIADTVAAFETGTITAEQMNAINIEEPENRAVFETATGISLDQYNVYDKRGNIDEAASNIKMQKSLFAMAAENYIESARIEQENWNDEARGAMAELLTANLGGTGDKAVQAALDTVDPRDGDKFMLTGAAARRVYEYARYTTDEWNDASGKFKDMFRNVDKATMRDVFDAAKVDKAKAETKDYGRQIVKNSLTDNTVVAEGKFQNKAKRRLKNSDLRTLSTVADALGVDVVMTDTLEAGDNGAYDSTNRTITLNAANTMDENLSFVFSHEVTHHLAAYAPDEYLKLSRFVMDRWYKANPEEYKAQISYIQELYKKRKGQDLSPERALEEIIADQAHNFNFWNDEEFMDAVTREEPTLAQAIINAIRDILSKLRQILASGNITDERTREGLFAEINIYDQAYKQWMVAFEAVKKAAADRAVDEWDQNAWTKDKESETRYNEKETRHSLGYHAGDLGKSTVDDYYNQGYGRGTGHFGFGTYFVGNPDRIKNYNKRNGEDAPVETVDFDKYNLFKPRDFDRGIALHDALKLVDGYITDYSKFTKYDKTSDEYMENLLDNTSRINRAAENLVDDYEWNDYQWDDSTQENKAKVDKYIADYLSDYDRSEIESKAQKEYDKVQSQSVDEEAVRKELADNYDKFKNTTDFWGNPFIRDESEEAYIERNLQDTIDIRNRDKDVPYDYYYYKAAQDAIKDNTENWEFKNRKLNWLSSDLMDALNYRHSKEEIENALRKTGEIVSEYVPEGQPRMQAERGLDSAATVFMKQLGYEGVDVRHINELDTTGFGSVIYDLKDEDLERKQEIGTARFSLSEPVERDNDLVAIHNLPEWKLKATLKLGGFPMPSIAVTNKNHTNFGDISLLFNSDTIDPQKDKENKVYSADAWTPTVPSTDYESDHKVVNRVFNTVRDLIEDDEHYRSNSSGYLHYSSIEDALKNRKGFDGLIDYMMEKPFMQYAYLKSKGEDFKIPQKDVKETKDWKEERVDRYNDMLEKFGGEDGLMDLLKIPMKELFEREDVKSYISENLVKMKDGRERPGKFAQKLFTTLAAEAVVYNMDPDKTFSTKTVNDYSEADRQLAKRIDKDEMRSWLKDLFDGIIADSGVYNGKDPFTPAGKSRTFKQLHYPATAEGIVQAMKAQGEKNISNVTTTKTLRADLSKSFKSLADIRSRKDKLHDLSEEEVEKIYDELDEKFMEIISGIAKDSPNSSNDLFEYDYIGNNISECAQLGYTKPEQIIKKLKEYGYVVTEDNAKKTLLLFDAIREMPVNMFEAKPRRVVGFREIKAAIVPDNVDPEIRSELELLEVPIYDYASGDDAERVDKVNQAATDQDIRFSIAETDSDGNTLTEAQRRFFNDSLAVDDQGRLQVVYHTTNNGGFTVFDPSYSDDRRSLFFASNFDVSQTYGRNASSKVILNPEQGTNEQAGYYEVYLNLQNPLIVDNGHTDNWSSIQIPKSLRQDMWDYFGYMFSATNTRGYVEFAAENGYDGVIFRNIRDIGGQSPLDSSDVYSDVYVAFKPEQIKDIRNENPTENPDIRWSIPEEDEVNSRIAYENSISDSYDLVMQYEASAAMGETDAWMAGQAWLAGINEEDLNKFYAGLNDDEAVPFSDPVLEEDRVRMAKSKSDFYTHLNAKWQDRWTTEGELLDIKSVRKDIKELVTGVMANSDTTAKYRNDIVKKTLFDLRTAYQLSKQGRADIVSALLYHSAQRMIDGVEFYIDDTFGEYKLLRDYLKATKISLGEEYWADVDYDAFRKRNFGRLKLVKGNTDVDEVYKVLCDRFPQWFNEEEEMNPADQLLQIEYALDTVQPYKEAYSSEAAAELAFDIADSLYDIMEGGKEYKSLADTYKERFDAKTKAMKQRHAEAMLRMRQQAIEGVQAERAKWRAKEERRKERAEHTKRFDQLKNNYDWLTERLLNPTKEKNIPEQLRKPLAELLQLFDFQTERSKSLEERYGKVARKTLKMRELKDKIAAVSAEDDSGELPFNSWLQGTMEQLAEQLDGAPIDSLNSQDIRLINEVLTTIIHGIRNRQNLIAKEKQETIAKYGDGTITAMDSRMEKYGPRKQFQGKALQWLETLVNEGMETASYFFGRIDPNNTGIGALYKDLERGEDKYIENTAFLKRRMREITGKYMNRKRPGSKVEEWRKASNAIEFNLESGETISLTPAQIMSIYCLNKRPQAQDHLYVGGIVTTPASVGSVLQSFKRKAQKVSAARVTPADVENMITKLTPEQIQVADQLQSLMSKEMSDWGNETSMQMYGIKMFKEKEYFPLKVSREVLPNDLDKVANDTNEKIRNFGFTKPLTPNAQNAVYIDDIFAVAADHCNKMALYNAMAIPIMNFNRVYNYKQKHDDGSVSTVQEKIGDAFTNKANAYIKTFLSDLNGNTQTRSDATEALIKIALSNYKKAAIGINGRVALQQVTALPRAFMEINPKYFAGTFFTPADMRDMFEHCPKALWKSWGNYEMDLGRDMEDVMMNKDWSRRDVIEMGIYGMLDNYTWTKIWQAVKRETKAKHKNVEYESQEFYDICNERARDIFNRTQVVDSLFNRSAEMRSKNLFTKMLTSFKAEPTLTYNVFRNALVNGAEKMRDGDIAGGAATFGKAAAVLTLCAAYTSAMAALWDAVRRKGADDDEDKKFSELWWLNFLDNFFNDNAPWKQWNNIYFISDAINLKDGWGTSNMAFEGFEAFWKGYNDLIKKLNGESKKSWYDIVEELAGGIGYIFGVPTKTVMHDPKQMLKWFGIDVFAADGTVNEAIDKAIGGLVDKTKSLDLSEGPDLGSKLNDLFGGYDPETEAFVVNRPVEEDDSEYGKLEEKAAEIANSTNVGTQRNSELWSALTNGYTKSLADADFERIDKLRAIYKANGGDVEIWDEKIMKACKTAYKKTLIADATSADLNRQDAIREYMTNHGVTDAEISDLCYKSDTAKDLKAAMRLNNEDLMVDEMVTLMNAGISDEDLIKLYDNRNRGRDTYDGKYKDLFKSTGTYKWPINGSITSEFGHRSSPGGIGSTNHQGLDIAGNMGDPVGASDGGTVIFAGWYGGAGKTVKIEHDDGTITQYSHLSWWGVKEGDVVGQGQTIGNVGSTGNSTGPHLHFGVIKDGSYVNPREYLSE